MDGRKLDKIIPGGANVGEGGGHRAVTGKNKQILYISRTRALKNMSIDYDLQIINKEDWEDIVDFIRKHFMKDEPINKSINLITKEKPINKDLENFLLKDYANGVCLKAILNENIVAVSINSIKHKNQDDNNNIVKSEDTGFNTIVNFLSYIDKHSDSFTKFSECDKAMALGILAVDPRYRRMGIARRLIEATWDLGKKHNCGFMTVECSSHFTAKALEKLGFELIYKLNYEDYKVDGEVVFKTEPPHDASTVYVKKIQ